MILLQRTNQVGIVENQLYFGFLIPEEDEVQTLQETPIGYRPYDLDNTRRWWRNFRLELIL